MKRSFSIFSAVLWILVLCLSACMSGGTTVPSGDVSADASSRESGADGPFVFSAGFSRKEITPTESVPMSGYGNDDKRMSKGYLDPLTVSCIAIRDEEGTILLLLTVDLQGSRTGSEARKAIHEATGVPTDHILVTGTHTHSSVSDSEAKQQKYESVRNFLANYYEKAAEAAKEAIQDLKPAEMYYTTADLTDFNFVKHYYNENGEAMGDNHGSGTPQRHTTEANHTMYLLKFARTGGKDICLMNWRAHATLTGNAGKNVNLSADFPAPLRKRVEETLDCYAAYFQGEAGNINPKSRLESENLYDNYVEYGYAMGDIVAAALSGEMTPVKSGPIRTIEEGYTASVNHSKDSKLYEAQQVLNYFRSAGGTVSEANRRAKEIGLESVYDCEMVVYRAALLPTVTTEIHATRIGDFALIHFPNELFDSLGVKLRESSPTEALFIMGYSNEYNTYIPSKEAFEYGCYEADVSLYYPGEGEKLVECLSELLNSLFH